MQLSLHSLLLCLSLPLLAHAFIGYGIPMYNPSCAFACRAAIASATLTCTDNGNSGHSHHGGSTATTPECRASNAPFLTTLAWCMKSTCAEFDIEAWRLEKYWMDQAAGDKTLPLRWTYAESIQLVTGPPVQDFDKEVVMNTTVAVPVASWEAQKYTLEHFAGQEILHARYG